MADLVAELMLLSSLYEAIGQSPAHLYHAAGLARRGELVRAARTAKSARQFLSGRGVNIIRHQPLRQSKTF